MTSLHEIENAIRMLSSEERGKLIHDLPSLLPELEGDIAWRHILDDTAPRPGFAALLDEMDSQYKKSMESFPEIKTKDFDI